jgi:hypothetical protein
MGIKSDFWKGHLAAWRSGDLSQAAYCREHGLSVPSFGYWRRRLGMPPPSVTPALVPVVVEAVERPDETIEVSLRNGLRVHLPVAMEAARWLPLLRALHAC